MKQVSEFLKFVTAQVGNYYWFGTFGQTASVSLYNDRKAAYPNQYKASDYKEQIANPKPCFDCAGLVKSMWVYPKYNAADDLGATGIYGKCTEKGELTSESQLKPGYLVFKGNAKTKTHVGTYIGSGIVVEAKGHSYGVIESDFASNNWSFWAKYYNVDYTEVIPDPEPQPSGECHHDMIVNTQYDDLMLRSGPGTCYPVIVRMPKGSHVTWSGIKEGEWLKVTYQHYTGWAHSNYLKL